jgi:hypothetical protein
MNKVGSSKLLMLSTTRADDWFMIGLNSARQHKAHPETQIGLQPKIDHLCLTSTKWRGFSVKREFHEKSEQWGYPQNVLESNKKEKDYEKPKNFQIRKKGFSGVTSSKPAILRLGLSKDLDQAMILSRSFDNNKALDCSILDKSFKRQKIEMELRSTKFRLLTSNCSDSISLNQGLKTLQKLTNKHHIQRQKNSANSQEVFYFNFSIIQELLLIADYLQADKYWPTSHHLKLIEKNEIAPFCCEIEAILPQSVKSRPIFQALALLQSSQTSSAITLSTPKYLLSKKSLTRSSRKQLVLSPSLNL